MRKLLKNSINLIIILSVLLINTNTFIVFATQEDNIENNTIEHLSDKSTVDDYKKIISNIFHKFYKTN